ncbi:hypothetical protein [Methylocapsa aurea]|uniref:hypothetical protein n=1 Tax=Methylocapsa aurea TaxID=663610 RepID=UPI00192E354F|nr:hypothetical protein [Methylocapsa aurea]
MGLRRPYGRVFRTVSSAGRLERFLIRWNHLIEKKSLKFNELEHVLIEKVDQNML